MFQKTIFLLSIILITWLVALQATEDNLKFQKVTLEDGLTDDRYNDFVYVDSRGFVWISSIDGLNRYDGKRVKTYRYESGLNGKIIQGNFFENNGGDIWFTTYKAINCYKASLDSIINYQIRSDDNQLITKGYRAFHLDTLTNYLWLKVNTNIYKWNIDSIGKFECLPVECKGQFINAGFNEDGYLNKIIANTNQDSVRFIYLNKNNTYQDFKIPNKDKAVQLGETKWLFYVEDKLLVFDEKKPNSIRQLETQKQNKITDVIKYKGNRIFILTFSDGLWLYDWKNEKIVKQWNSGVNNQFSLLTNSLRKGYLSSSKYLWISHKNKGINYSNIYNDNFSNPLEGLTEKNLEVMSIIEDKDSNIWVATKYNGIYVFSPNGKIIRQFSHPYSISDKSELWNVCENHNGGILATTTKAIYQFNLKESKPEKIIASSDSLILWFMKPLFKNRILISTPNGLVELNKDKKNKYALKYVSEFSSYKETSFIQLFKAKNKVLIPYNSSGLWIFEVVKDSLEIKVKNDTCNLQFYGFCESKKKPDIVWAGTSNGLKLINEKNEIKSVFNDNSELANGNVYGIVEDKKGILWLTTNRGLWKYNPNKPNEKPIHFEEADGLSGELFSLYHSAILASDGSIWLGNNKGLVKFHPDSIKVHKEIPKLHLDELLVNDTKSFRKKIEDHTLVLEHDQNTLTFDIKAVNLYKTKQNKIYYRLAGYDEAEDTLQINNGEKIRYTKIKPGEYELYACAEDANGHKSEVKKLLDLKINAPWWLTKPALILYTLLSAFITYALLKWRESYIIEEQNKKAAVEKLKAQVKLKEETKKREIEKLEAQALLKQQAQKTEIAELETQVLEVQMTALRVQMNPHFLFNSLNSIKSLILKTQEKEASTYLSKFSTLLRSILNNSEKPKIKLSEEIEALRLYVDLEALRFASNFNYQIQIDKTIDSSFIRIPPLLLQPFVENAIWHGLLPKPSGDPKLNINIIRNEDFLFFEIEDNGIGRTKATTLPKKENRKSLGIEITKKRIQLLHPDNDIEIIDLGDCQQQALGTKVVIQLFAPE